MTIDDERDHPFLEAALENAEAVLDSLTDDELLKEIPLVGTAVKLLRGASTIRDRIFAAKILRFLQDLDSVSPETREKIRTKMASDPDEARAVGETALVLLERSSAVEKARLIAILFLAYVDGHITVSEFRRLSTAVDQAFLDDLEEFLHRQRLPEKSTEPFMQYLAASGLTAPVAGQTWDDIGELFYHTTRLGHKLRNAHFAGRNLLGTPR